MLTTGASLRFIKLLYDFFLTTAVFASIAHTVELDEEIKSLKKQIDKPSFIDNAYNTFKNISPEDHFVQGIIAGAVSSGALIYLASKIMQNISLKYHDDAALNAKNYIETQEAGQDTNAGQYPD